MGAATAAALMAACSSPPPHTTQQCAAAAATHALAEQRWLDIVQTNALASAAAAADHTHDHSPTVDDAIAARVDSLITEAATRYHCGTR